LIKWNIGLDADYIWMNLAIAQIKPKKNVKTKKTFQIARTVLLNSYELGVSQFHDDIFSPTVMR
jgi:hypothetical protein